MDINDLTGPELAHFGVLGMKWGRRKGKVKASASPGSKHQDYLRAHSGKSYKSMSTKELKETNERLQAEKTYKELTSKQKKKGQNWITNTLKQVGSQQLGKALNKYVVPAVFSFVASAAAAYATSGRGGGNPYSRTVKAARKAYTQKLLN